MHAVPRDDEPRDKTNGHNHVVGFYRRDEELISAVTPFLSSALGVGGAAVVIATPAHRDAFAGALESGGHSLEALIRSGRYQSVDAADTLARFMGDGRPDAGRFASVIGSILAGTGASASPVHAFGEMVSLLWDAGNVTAAIELESLWNDLSAHHDFALFCAYAMSSLEHSNDLVATKQVCDRHSRVIPLDHASEHFHAIVGPGRDAVDQLFVPSASVLGDVRLFVRDVLVRWGEASLVSEGQLIVSELATNAIVHARSPFLVSISRTISDLRIAVRDVSAGIPERQGESSARIGGRGIALVASTARAWDTHEETDGKTIWATLPRSSVELT